MDLFIRIRSILGILGRLFSMMLVMMPTLLLVLMFLILGGELEMLENPSALRLFSVNFLSVFTMIYRYLKGWEWWLVVRWNHHSNVMCQ